MNFYSMVGVAALGSRIRRLAEMITKDAESVCAMYESNIDPRWFPVFYMLAHKGTATVTELAQDVGQSHAAVSQVAKKMVAKGMVKQAKGKKDSRVTELSLTPKGQASFTKLKLQITDVEHAVNELLEDAGVDFWAAINAVEHELSQENLLKRTQKFKKRREKASVTIVPYTAEYAEAFRRLNLDWIEKYFTPEPSDYKALDHPQEYILDPGGFIFMALKDGQAVGTCGAIKMSDTKYEMAKMGVSDSAKGCGIGEMLARAVIEESKKRGATQVYLESNTGLVPAITLYRKLGFQQIIGDPSPYARADIQMMLDV